MMKIVTNDPQYFLACLACRAPHPSPQPYHMFFPLSLAATCNCNFPLSIQIIKPSKLSLLED